MNTKTHNPATDKSLFFNCKLPIELKKRLDATCNADDSAISKTGLVRKLLIRYFDALDHGRKLISIE